MGKSLRSIRVCLFLVPGLHVGLAQAQHLEGGTLQESQVRPERAIGFQSMLRPMEFSCTENRQQAQIPEAPDMHKCEVAWTFQAPWSIVLPRVDQGIAEGIDASHAAGGGGVASKGVTAAAFSRERVPTRRLSAGSLVRYTGTLPTNPTAFVPVSVVEANRTFNPFYNDTTRNRLASSGDEGYVRAGLLKRAADYKYIVKEDTTLVNTIRPGEGGAEMKGAVVQLATRQPGNDPMSYKVTRCPGESDYSYVFETKLRDGRMYDVRMDQACPVSPISPDMLRSYEKINAQLDTKIPVKDFEYTPHGFTPVPINWESEHQRNISGTGDHGVVHYQGGDKMRSDVWGKPATVCSFLKLAKDFKKACNEKFPDRGCNIQLGDLSYPIGDGENKSASFTGRKCPLGHASHYKGTCFDMRPFRKDDALEGSTHGHSQYDREMTRLLLKTYQNLVPSGKRLVYFNDRTLIREGYSSRMASHDDHLHVCFNTPAEACK